MITKKNVDYQIIKDLPTSSVSASINVKGGNRVYSYKCDILIDQIAAYESGARIAKIDILSSLPNTSFETQPSNDQLTNPSEINRLLITSSERRSRSLVLTDEDLKKKLLFTGKIDIFSSSVKTSIETLRKTNFSNIRKTQISFQKTTPASSNIAFDQLQPQNVTDSNLGSQRLYSFLMLNGKDPAKQIILRSAVNDAQLTRSGLGEIVTYKKDNVVNEFVSIQNTSKSKNLADQSENQASVVKTTTTDILLPIKFDVDFSEVLNLNKLTILITIRDGKDNLIQKKDFIIDHRSQVIKLSTPKKLPSISFKKLNDSTINVNVFNTDSEIASIDFFVRYFKNYGSSLFQAPFTKTQSLNVGEGSLYYSAKLRVKSLNANQTIVRALPTLNSGILLGNFESKSFSAKLETTQGILYSYFNQDKVSVVLSDAPPSYGYVQFMRRSITKKERSYTDVGPLLNLENGDVSYDDFAVERDHVYEYAAMLKNRTGDQKKTARPTVVRTSNYTAGTSLGVQIVSQETLETGIKTKFNIQINLTKDTDTTLLLQNLKNAGIDNYYETEITKLSADLKNIVKVYARRINLTTGTTAELGIRDAGEFEDTAPPGEVYIFEGLVRSQADLLEEIGTNFVSSKILDPQDGSDRGQIASQTLTSTTGINKKNYTQKFFSKKSLLQGTISSGITRDYSADDSGFLSGRLGIASVIENSRQISNFTITGTDLVNVSRNRRLLSFDVDSNDSSIDFFIITCKRGDVTSPVGVCHYNPENTRQYFMDNITDLMSGTVSYIITPISYDGVSLQNYNTQEYEVM